MAAPNWICRGDKGGQCAGNRSLVRRARMAAASLPARSSCAGRRTRAAHCKAVHLLRADHSSARSAPTRRAARTAVPPEHRQTAQQHCTRRAVQERGPLGSSVACQRMANLRSSRPCAVSSGPIVSPRMNNDTLSCPLAHLRPATGTPELQAPASLA